MASSMKSVALCLLFLTTQALAFEPPGCYRRDTGACCPAGQQMLFNSNYKSGGVCTLASATDIDLGCSRSDTFGSAAPAQWYGDKQSGYNCVIKCTKDADCFPGVKTKYPGAEGVCDQQCLFSWIYIKSKLGRWQVLGSQGGGSSWSHQVTTGVSRADTNAESSEWGWKIGLSVTSGFDFFAKFEVTVSGEVSHQFSTSHSSTFTRSSTTSDTHNFLPGTAWQFVIDIEELAGKSTIYLNEYANTPGEYAPPCCLPGYWKNPQDATGECAADSHGNVFDACRGHYNVFTSNVTNVVI